MNCFKCNKPISRTRQPGVTCAICKKNIHTKCAGVEDTYNLIADGTYTFHCYLCKGKHRRSVVTDELHQSINTPTSSHENISYSVDESLNDVNNKIESISKVKLDSNLVDVLNQILESKNYIAKQYDDIARELHYTK